MTSDELAALVEQIPMAALVMVGPRILGANARMTELTGWSREELLGAKNPMLEFIAEEDQARILAQREARRRGHPAPDEFDMVGMGAGGRRVPARVRVSAFPVVGADAELFLFSDDRLRARAADLIRGFVDVAVAAQKERTRDAFFRTVREGLLALGMTSTVLEIERGHFRIAPFAPALTKPGQEARQRLVGWTPLAQMPMDLEKADGALIDNLPGFFAALTRVAPDRYLGRVPKRAVVAAIRLGGEARYALSASGDELDSAVAGAFGLLGRQLSAALETTLRLEELDRRNAELTLLLDLGQQVAALDVTQVLETAVRTATRSLRCSCAYIFLPDESGTALRIAAFDDPEPPPGLQPGHALPLDQPSLSAHAFRTQEAQLSEDNRADARVAGDVSRLFGCRSTLAVPLLSHGRALGVLTVFERSGRLFDAQDMRLAAHAAQLISPALENARLYAEQRGRAEEMALLNDIARQLAGSFDLQRLLALGGETVRRILEGDLWFAMLPDLRAGGLRFHALRPEHKDLAGIVLRFDEDTVATRAFRERRPVQVHDTTGLSLFSAQMTERLGTRTTLGIPLLAHDEVLGVVMVTDHRQSRSFSPAQLERAQAVAGQLGLAVLSARLYEDLRQSYGELARAQKGLVDRERLAALGELSASIAHEVRNPLGVIFNSVGSLRRLLKPQGDVALLLGIVGEEADRLNRMVGDLLDYSRPVQPALEPLPLLPLIQEALHSARQQIGPRAEGVKDVLTVDAGAETLRADGRLLRQAFINLFLNSYQAMPRAGTLTVHASRLEREGLTLAAIDITDTGAGIPVEARPKIFQPFFTTKAMGTGLGLAVVRRIVEGHGGTIELAGAENGAQFALRLPLEGGSR